MATDIAFGLAVLALLTRRTPRSLRLFVLTLAIVDDIGAIVVIALFYSDDIAGAWLLGALVVIAAMIAMRRLHVESPSVYAAPAAVLWVCVFESGVHATLAGVALGLLTPAAGPEGRRRIERLEATFHPWSSFLVVPLFALANAGVPLGASALRETFSGTVGVGILVGLVIGKPLGICTAVAIALRTRLARLPDDVTPMHILGAGMLAGIGFTVSLFIAGLSFGGTLLDEAKIGILVASVTSGLLGSAVLVRRSSGRVKPAER
jgi:NhaA family Na+:H+ antiporter